MLEGKADLIRACRLREMEVTERPLNLLISQVEAEGGLDGMTVRLEADCIRGMPGDSVCSITFSGNLGHLLAVLERVWPTKPRRHLRVKRSHGPEAAAAAEEHEEA